MPMLYVENSSIHYRVTGKGIPIVFIHPPVLTSETFKYQIEGLSQEFMVITFDIRGHGSSHYSINPVTYPMIAQDIKHLLDHLNIQKAFICGYSTGGSIVLEFLLTSADRALGGIVLSGMSEVSDRYLYKKIFLGMTLAKAGAVPFLAASISWSNSDSKAYFKEMYTAARKGDARNIEQYYRYSLHYNSTSQLGNIQLPVLLVYGEKDTPFSHYAKLLHETLPNNELIFINNEKHRIPSQAPDKLNEMIKRFIHVHHK